MDASGQNHCITRKEPTAEEQFRHTVEVWTVGDLKKALADIADDAKLIFSTAGWSLPPTNQRRGPLRHS
jgi:hypothetical protein